MSPEDRPESAIAELGGPMDDGTAGAASEGVVRPFPLGAETHPAAMPLAGLERIGERTARALRQVLEPLVRSRPAVVAEPLATQRFEGWRTGLAPFVSLSHYRAAALKGGLLIALDADFVTRTVDAFYGGTGGINALAPRAPEFTGGEERMAVRLADGLVEVLAAAWGELVPMEPVLAGRETAAAHAALVRGDEMVVVQRFRIEAETIGTTRLDVVYPFAALKPHAALAGARPRAAEAASPADGSFRRALAEALEDVRLPVRSVLARPQMSVGELLALKPGDVIPITLGPRVPLLVANRRVAEGTIGEQEGRAALMIEIVERGNA